MAKAAWLLIGAALAAYGVALLTVPRPLPGSTRPMPFDPSTTPLPYLSDEVQRELEAARRGRGGQLPGRCPGPL